MSLLKSVAVPTAITAAVCGVLAATAPAQSQGLSTCLPVGGGEICTYPGHSFDHVTATIPGIGSETIDVKCARGGYEFSSRGQWSQQEVETFVEGYCEGRGWYAHN